MAGADADARPGDWWADAVVFSLRRGTASNIWKVPINLKTFRIAGPAVRLTTGSALESFPRCSAYGQIVFVNQVQMTGIFSLRLDAKSGRAIGTPEPVIADLPFNYDTTAQRLSSDGTKLALNSNLSGSPEVLIKDLENGKETVLTTNLRPVNAPLISSDGSSLLFGSDDQGGTDIYVTGPGKPFAEKICSRCGTPLDWSSDGRLVLLEGPSRSSLFIWDRTSGTRREWLKYPAQSLQQASLSGDGKWVALMFSPEPGAFVTPLTSAPISRDQLVPLPVAPDMRSLEWSPDGKLLYYFSRLDDHRCLWAQRLEPATRHPAGAPFPVYHFHTNRLSPWGPGVSVGAGRLVFALTEPRSNIWLAAPAGPG
jgi:WD40 repeat protein